MKRSLRYRRYKAAFNIFYLCYLAAAAGWALYRTFTNIDMTRARLFVTFWPEWVGMIVVFLVLYFIRLRFFSRKINPFPIGSGFVKVDRLPPPPTKPPS